VGLYNFRNKWLSTYLAWEFEVGVKMWLLISYQTVLVL